MLEQRCDGLLFPVRKVERCGLVLLLCMVLQDACFRRAGNQRRRAPVLFGLKPLVNACLVLALNYYGNG
jgi:hypothetical protein